MLTRNTIMLAAGLVGLVLAEGAVLRGPGWQPGHAGEGFAVVELFTSEGCETCPPADELIARTQLEDRDLPVYILAFHVDYWDRLGWKDVFSDAAYTARQRQYAEWLHLSSVYTPEVVVNGRQEFVGSDAVSLSSAIRSGLKQTGTATLTLSGLHLVGSRLDWQYKMAGVAGSRTAGQLSLVAVVIERSAVTKVKAGENNGRTLSHVQIVRSIGMLTPDASGAGAGHLDWPTGLEASNAEIIALLQDGSSGKIFAATRTPIPK